MRNFSYAFSLIELSIVLVIFGLLTGGILAGQSLIRAAELRNVSVEYSRYTAATQAFRDKYFALPGDMANATSFWGAADGSTGMTAACKTTPATGAATCNGNGDGGLNAPSYSLEWFRYWQHLANASLIEGNFTGITDGTNDGSYTKNNSPASKLGNSIWAMSNWGTFSSNGSIFDGYYGHVLNLGGIQANNGPMTAILKPEEAWNVDTKMDDGKPAQGKIFARDVNGFTGTNCTTATASTMVTADYYLPQTALRCVLVFRQLL